MLFIYVGLNSGAQWERCGIPSLHRPSPSEKNWMGKRKNRFTHTRNHICYSYYEFELWLTLATGYSNDCQVRGKGGKEKKKDSFMIHFEPHRWEFSAANVFPSHFRWFLSSREREKKAGECQMVLAMLTGTTPLFAITWQPPPWRRQWCWLPFEDL